MAVIKFLPHSHDSLGGAKGPIVKIRKNSSSSQYFTEISHAIRDTINLKLMKLDLSSKASVWHPGWTKGMGQTPKLNFFGIGSSCISN